MDLELNDSRPLKLCMYNPTGPSEESREQAVTRRSERASRRAFERTFTTSAPQSIAPAPQSASAFTSTASGSADPLIQTQASLPTGGPVNTLGSRTPVNLAGVVESIKESVIFLKVLGRTIEPGLIDETRKAVISILEQGAADLKQGRTGTMTTQTSTQANVPDSSALQETVGHFALLNAPALPPWVLDDY